MEAKTSPVVAERAVSYEGFGLLTSHQIVTLVSATILQHSDKDALSKQIAAALDQEDHAGNFREVQTSTELASLLTKRVREVSRDARYEVLYLSAPPDMAEAYGRSFYRINGTPQRCAAFVLKGNKDEPLGFKVVRR